MRGRETIYCYSLRDGQSKIKQFACAWYVGHGIANSRTLIPGPLQPDSELRALGKPTFPA
jgi:hypothetical protein